MERNSDRQGFWTMTDRESIRQTLIAYLEDDLGETLPSFDDDVNLRDGLGLDSVDVVGLVMQVERLLRVRLASEELAAVVTVGDLLTLLEAKKAAGDVARGAA
jgi:acyl carrier protein